MKTSTHIEKQIEIKAPVSRVWRALTNHKEFGAWFQAEIDTPFIPGKSSKGRIKVEGFEKLKLELAVLKVEPESFFSYTWHPYALDPAVDYDKETPTLVEFRLKKIPVGTLLTVTESGFDKVPAHRRRAVEAYSHARRRLGGADAEHRGLCRKGVRSTRPGGLACGPGADLRGARRQHAPPAGPAGSALGEPRSISELTMESRLTRQAITKHLRILENVGIVRAERRGREILFRFSPAPVDEAVKYLELVSRHWDEALGRLKSFVENDPEG